MNSVKQYPKMEGAEPRSIDKSAREPGQDRYAGHLPGDVSVNFHYCCLFSARQRFDGYRVWLGTGAEREACLRASCSVVILYAR